MNYQVFQALGLAVFLFLFGCGSAANVVVEELSSGRFRLSHPRLGAQDALLARAQQLCLAGFTESRGVRYVDGSWEPLIVMDVQCLPR